MYKLIYFKATNFTGFMSGLQQKTFELDLTDLHEKDIIAIMGDNATGKSTFASLVHPSHTPTNKKTNFVLEGKEGTLIREYRGDDGSLIITKCIYTPNKDGKHNSKLFFKVIYPDGSETELNENGNVSSYYDLIKTYFGINKHFINFASYNNSVKGIVSMTDGERKDSMSTLIPNTIRFELAHNVINEKHKYYKNTIKDISNKLLKLHDEKFLEVELKEVEKLINIYSADSGEYLKEQGILIGKRSSILKDIDESTLFKDYKSKVKELDKLTNKIHEYNNSDICNESIENLEDASKRIDKTLTTLHNELETLKEKTSTENNNKYLLEKELDELNIALSSISSNNLEELQDIKNKLLSTLDELETPVEILKADKYTSMNIEELESVQELLWEIHKGIETVVENHPHIFYNKFSFRNISGLLNTSSIKLRDYTNNIHISNNEISRVTNLIDTYSTNDVEYILANIPKDCVSTTCPFIINATEWRKNNGSLDELKNKLSTLTSEHSHLTQQANLMKDIIEFCNQISPIIMIIDMNKSRIEKYLDINIEKFKSIIHSEGNLYTLLGEDSYINTLPTIISDMVIYNDITNTKLPNIDRELSIISSNNTTYTYMTKAIEDKKKLINIKQGAIKIYQDKSFDIVSMIESLSEDAVEVESKLSKLNNYLEITNRYSELKIEIDSISIIINDVEKIDNELDKVETNLKKIQREIRDLLPKRDKLTYEKNLVLGLKADKAIIETDFDATTIMKSIIQPGKGIWKYILDIYMADVREITNQLLSTTFGGELFLEKFIIDETSFIIPYSYKGNIGADISLSSDSQQSTISTSMSIAILSIMISKYGIATYDEVDKDLSPKNKERFINTLATRSKLVGLNQNFIITHSSEYYEPHDVGYILFPGADLKNKKNKDFIEI